MFSKLVKVAAIALPLSMGSVAANAFNLSTNGGSGNFSWSFLATCTDFDECGNAQQLITGNGTVSSSLSGGNLDLAFTLNNTTSVPAGNNMALLSFGFGINPNANTVAMLTPGSSIDQATLDSIPSLALIEVCAWAGNSCNGGSVNDGIQALGSDSFTLRLTSLSSWGESVFIDPIGFKFQGTIGSFEFTTSSGSSSGGTSSGNTSNGNQVPEPSSSLVLLGLGALGMGFVRRLKKAA